MCGVKKHPVWMNNPFKVEDRPTENRVQKLIAIISNSTLQLNLYFQNCLQRYTI